MGYRSDVAIAIKKDTYNKVLAQSVISDIPFPTLLEYTRAGKPNFGYFEYLSNTSTYYWLYDDIKWYELSDSSGFLEIREVMAFLHYLQEHDDHQHDFGYLRIGEEPGDTDERGEPCNFDLYIHQSISHPL